MLAAIRRASSLLANSIEGAISSSVCTPDIMVSKPSTFAAATVAFRSVATSGFPELPKMARRLRLGTTSRNSSNRLPEVSLSTAAIPVMLLPPRRSSFRSAGSQSLATLSVRSCPPAVYRGDVFSYDPSALPSSKIAAVRKCSRGQCSDLTRSASPLRWRLGCRDVREGVPWRVYNVYLE